MWDQRYDTDEYIYGTQPNDFLSAVVDRLASDHPPGGRVLCLAEGEGRNAVFMAERGFRVLALDASSIGLSKAQRLAEERGVSIDTQVIDLAHYNIEPGAWDVIVSVFCHVPTPIRQQLHQQVVAGLRSGGAFILEAYTPEQLNYGTGGPPVAELMMSLTGLQMELAGLDFEHGMELVRDIQEGKLHTGKGAVVQVLAFKP